MHMKHPPLLKILKKNYVLQYMCAGIIYISQNCFLMIIYIYTLRVFVCNIGIVWPTGRQANTNVVHLPAFFGERNTFSYNLESHG